MAENLFNTFKISGLGMSVQRMRLSAVADNIANANTTKAENGKAYQRKVVLVRGTKQSQFQNELSHQLGLKADNSNGHLPSALDQGQTASADPIKANIGRDNSEPRLVYDPSHPDANDEGYVEMPNVNVVSEMVEMISAQRAFEANTQVVGAAKNIARDALDI